VWRRNVRRKPTNWKKKEMNMLTRNTQTDPDGRSSMIMSEPRSIPGACTVVSQYGGTESAWAAA
jgi:hypothetical protein